MVPDVMCLGCEQKHDERWLCDPNKALLDAIAAKAGSYTLEPTQFDQPVPANADQVADVLIRQLTVTAGTADVAGIARPLIILSGRDQADHPLPRWLYIGAVQDLQRARDLFARMVSMAINQARQKRK